ncbi:MAG: GNAT family N-acetyltransferase [Candidatus Eremiobacteraeota bacterium]|nr:GNAT family N-acetyltransferase [Candidatus Eremiobacteraeota bacterium]
MTVRIERATPDDAAALAPLFDAYRRFFTGCDDLTESRRFLAQRLTQGDGVVFIARCEEIPCGFTQLYPLWSSWHCKRMWFLSDLYVAEEKRRYGIGGRLVAMAKTFAAETEASSVVVEVPRQEPRLQTFYAALGFHEDDLFTLARYQP